MLVGRKVRMGRVKVSTGFVYNSFGEPLDYFDSPSVGFELLAHHGLRIGLLYASTSGRRVLKNPGNSRR
jgi:hypothetical protein